MKTPVAVLGWERGRTLDPDMLGRTFRHLQFPRTVNRNGYVSVQRFYIYAEQGLAKQRVAVWIYEDRLNVEYEQTLLARYQCRINRQQRSLKSVSKPKLYQTPFASPQMELFQLHDEQWLKVLQRLPYSRRKLAGPMATQLTLLTLEFALCFFLFGR